MNTFGPREKLILTIKIDEDVVESSTIIDEKTKEACRNFTRLNRQLLVSNPELSAFGLNTLKNALLTHWNESINPDTERFWTALSANGIDYERKEPLKFALEKGRFRNVHQGMEARKNWNELKTLSVIQARFSTMEIERINRIIADDEKRRAGFLMKCLKKKEIPQSEYLKFGDCMAYMSACRLFDRYFQREEIVELRAIWANFKSK